MTWSSTATRGLTEPRRPLGELGGFGSLAFSIPLGLSAGRPFSPLSRAISARWAATVCSSAATLPSSSMTSAFSLVGERASRSPDEAILPGNQRQARRGSENRAATGSAAVTTLAHAGEPFCSAWNGRHRDLPRRVHPLPIQPFEQGGELGCGQPHDPVLDLGPTELALFEPLGDENHARAVPEHQLDPVSSFGP